MWFWSCLRRTTHFLQNFIIKIHQSHIAGDYNHFIFEKLYTQDFKQQKYIQSFLMMQNQPIQKPVLIYFKARGIAQIIRLALFQIGVDFEEVFVTCCGYLDPQIIKRFNIDIKCLPYLIHNGMALTGIFPILKYLCNQFQRPQLLGKTMEDQIYITQMMVKQLRQKGLLLHTLFKGLKEVYDKNLGEQGIDSLKNKIREAVISSKQLAPLMQMFLRTGQFIFGYMTVLDFVYYDKSFYATNFNKEDKNPEIKIAKKYLDFFQSTELYRKNEKRIKEYKVFFPETDCTINMLIQKMWMGDPSYIGCQKKQ